MKKISIIFFIVLLCTQICYAKSKTNFEGMGYVGTLPDLSRQFSPSEPKSVKPVIEQVEDFHSADQLKPIPRENPAFVNIILKPDKLSPYLNDINNLLPQLENILTCIEEKYDVQKFNAKCLDSIGQFIQFIA